MSNRFLHFSWACTFSRKLTPRSGKHRLLVVSTAWLFSDKMIKQLSLPLNVFAKSATCPCATDLLTFSQHMLQPRRAELIEEHLDECDFCRAELQLLERFPCPPEAVPVGEIPPGLRALAESILQNLQRPFSTHIAAYDESLMN